MSQSHSVLCVSFAIKLHMVSIEWNRSYSNVENLIEWLSFIMNKFRKIKIISDSQNKYILPKSGKLGAEAWLCPGGAHGWLFPHSLPQHLRCYINFFSRKIEGEEL